MTWQTALPFTGQNNSPQIDTGVTDDAPLWSGISRFPLQASAGFSNAAAFLLKTVALPVPKRGIFCAALTSVTSSFGFEGVPAA
jgi:hypothetical protein